MPTKIYTPEIMKITSKDLINSAAHITGGGLIENIIRSVPEKLTINIDLSKIKIKPIFKWIKKKGLSDREMLKTFNCGVGFCLIISSKNLKKINKFFLKEYKPYVIGKIIHGKNKVKLNAKINWY